MADVCLSCGQHRAKVCDQGFPFELSKIPCGNKAEKCQGSEICYESVKNTGEKGRKMEAKGNGAKNGRYRSKKIYAIGCLTWSAFIRFHREKSSSS